MDGERGVNLKSTTRSNAGAGGEGEVGNTNPQEFVRERANCCSSFSSSSRTHGLFFSCSFFVSVCTAHREVRSVVLDSGSYVYAATAVLVTYDVSENEL